MSSNEPSSRPTLAELLATYETWNRWEVLDTARRRAEASGDHERAAAFRQGQDEQTARTAVPSALDALVAQRELSELLEGWSWHTVRAARESGASWQDVARATRRSPAEERSRFLDEIDRARRSHQMLGIPFDDALRNLVAAGDWTHELHPDTPTEARSAIDDALTRGDSEALAAQRQRWWNPDHRPGIATWPYAASPEEEHPRREFYELRREPPGAVDGREPHPVEWAAGTRHGTTGVPVSAEVRQRDLFPEGQFSTYQYVLYYEDSVRPVLRHGRWSHQGDPSRARDRAIYDAEGWLLRYAREPEKIRHDVPALTSHLAFQSRVGTAPGEISEAASGPGHALGDAGRRVNHALQTGTAPSHRNPPSDVPGRADRPAGGMPRRGHGAPITQTSAADPSATPSAPEQRGRQR